MDPGTLKISTRYISLHPSRKMYLVPFILSLFLQSDSLGVLTSVERIDLKFHPTF